MRLCLLLLCVCTVSIAFGQDKRPQSLPYSPVSVIAAGNTAVKAAPSLAGKLFNPAGNQQQSAVSSQASPFSLRTIDLPNMIKSSAAAHAVNEGFLNTIDARSININLDQVQAKSAVTLSAKEAAAFVIKQIDLPLIDASKELQFSSERIDRADVRHLRLTQMKDGVRVLGGELIIHQNIIGKTTVSGRLQPSLKSFDVSPEITASQALDEAYGIIGRKATYQQGSAMQLAQAIDVGPELVIWFDANKVPQLAYVMTLHPNLAGRYEVIVSAEDGRELKTQSQICNLNHDDFYDHLHDHPRAIRSTVLGGPVTATARDLNNSLRTLQIFDESTFFLVDATRPMYNSNSQVPGDMQGVLVTANAQGTYPDNSFNAVYSTSSANSWTDRREVSAHYNAEQSYEYFRRTFGRNSIDGQGGTVVSFVNVTDENGSQMDNAFWNGRSMFYGNGNRDFTPLAGALDVGGHEMSHGVVQETANLEYQDESGALNESFADIFGAMIDRDDWLIGEDIARAGSFPGGALRSMSDPHNGGNSLSDRGYQPRHYNERYQGTQDNGGVHINSGIPNHAYYLIATTIGKDKAEQIFYDVLDNYLTRNSRFIDFRNALQQRTEMQYGLGSSELNAVVAGLDAVGIPGSSGGGGGTTGPINQSVNPGDELIVFADAAEQVVRLANSDGETIIADITPSVAPASKISVSDDGSQAMLAATNGQLNQIFINYSNNTVSENLVSIDIDGNGSSDVRSVALSRSGTHFAIVTTAQDAFVYVYEIASGQGSRFRLYTPGSNGEPLYTVDYADALEWDYAGRSILFDGLNTLTGTGGLSYTNWDIGILNVLDGPGQDWSDGRVQKIFGSLEEGTSLGNPTLAKNSENIMAFDYFVDDEWNTVAINLLNNEANVIFQGGDLGWPTFSASDELLIFNAINNGEEILATVVLGADKISNGDPQGRAFLYANDAYRGTAFANGQRIIVSAVPTLLAGAAWTLAPNPAHDRIEIFRNGEAPISSGDFELYDNSGRLLSQYNSATLRIDLTQLASGSYVLRQGDRSEIFLVK